MIDEVEEIMDESETLSPKEYRRSLNISAIVAFLPTLYKHMLQDPTAKMYIQFCFYKKDWVLAGFKNGDGCLGTINAIANHHDKALFIKIVTDTRIGNKLNINSISHLSDTLEAKALRESLKELFNFVSTPHVTVMQKHRSVAWYVKGVRK